MARTAIVSRSATVARLVASTVAFIHRACRASSWLKSLIEATARTLSMNIDSARAAKTTCSSVADRSGRYAPQRTSA